MRNTRRPYTDILMRAILHCDINNCFASIETAINPKLLGLPVAVCGNPLERRGIVLAKSEQAKKYGVKTGDTLWEARQKCKDIIFIPPHYDTYVQYSEAIQKYYAQFTPQIEPFGLDECWLDVSHHPDPIQLAEQIRQDIRRIFHITVSIGVSFNKVFAKLGSDLKKPDAVTAIPAETYRHIIWGLPVSTLLGAGRATSENLRRIGICSIGQLASADRKMIRARLGKHGDKLWCAANGQDNSPVLPIHLREPRQSIGHGTTLPYDMHASHELWPTIQVLAERTAFGLHSEALSGLGIAIMVRDTTLCFRQYQTNLRQPIASSSTIAQYALMLLSQHYPWDFPIRAFSIRVFHLVPENTPRQLSLFDMSASKARQNVTDRTLQAIQTRYGTQALYRGYQLGMPSCPKNTFPNACSAKQKRPAVFG
jgi:DNA polymerase-4